MKYDGVIKSVVITKVGRQWAMMEIDAWVSVDVKAEH